MLDCFEMFVLVVNHCYEFEFDDIDFASVCMSIRTRHLYIFIRVYSFKHHWVDFFSLSLIHCIDALYYLHLVHFVISTCLSYCTLVTVTLNLLVDSLVPASRLMLSFCSSVVCTCHSELVIIFSREFGVGFSGTCELCSLAIFTAHVVAYVVCVSCFISLVHWSIAFIFRLLII